MTPDDPQDSRIHRFRFESTTADPFGEQQLVDQGMDPTTAKRFAEDIRERHEGLPTPGQKFEIEYLVQYERLTTAADDRRDAAPEHPVVAAVRDASHPILKPSVGEDWTAFLDWVCVGSGWHTSMDGVAIRCERDSDFVIAMVGSSFGTNPDLTDTESIRLDVHGMVNGPLGLKLPDLGDDEEDDDLNNPLIAVEYRRALEASELKVLNGVLEHGVEHLELSIDGSPTPFRLLTYADSWCARGVVDGTHVVLYGRGVGPAAVEFEAVDPEPFVERYLAKLATEAAAAGDDEEDDEDWSEEENSRNAHRPRRITARDVSKLIEFRPLRIAQPRVVGSLVGWSSDDVDVVQVKLGYRLGSEVGQAIVATGTTFVPRDRLLHEQGRLFELPDEQETRLIQRLLLASPEVISIHVDGHAVSFSVVEWEDTFSAWAWTGDLGIEIWGRGIDVRSLQLESVHDLAGYVGSRP